jgi:hypothetical protein
MFYILIVHEFTSHHRKRGDDDHWDRLVAQLLVKVMLSLL